MKERFENKVDGYIGTYASGESRGVYHFTFNRETGQMTEPELFYEAPDAKWVSLYENHLAFPVREHGRAGTCLLTLEDGRVRGSSQVLMETQTPCFILQENDYLFTANYHEGSVLIYRVEQERLKFVKRIESGAGAGCHQVLMHGSLMLVPCLTQNRIRLFDRDKDFEPAGEIGFPEGTGPRHGIFNRAHTKLYVVSEWSNLLFVFNVREGEFTQVQSLSVLSPDIKTPPHIKDETAAIHMTLDETYLYVSVRGQDQMAVLDISGEEARMVQHISCGGVYPRDFILSHDEEFVLTANRFKGGIVCRRRDRDTGRLLGIESRIPMPEGVSLVLAE